MKTGTDTLRKRKETKVETASPKQVVKTSQLGNVTRLESDPFTAEDILNSSISSPRGTKDPRRKPWDPSKMRASTDVHIAPQASLLSMALR
jgi:hypothetical protein